MELSAWEGEFLESVEERVKTYGRAFADPDKGAPGATFSALQGVKLKEIAAKAGGKAQSGEKRAGEKRAGEKRDGRFGRRPPKRSGRGFGRKPEPMSEDET